LIEAEPYLAPKNGFPFVAGSFLMAQPPEPIANNFASAAVLAGYHLVFDESNEFSGQADFMVGIGDSPLTSLEDGVIGNLCQWAKSARHTV
jgi:hypothetical protein